jgi:FKBP-type peptidyl-prolyl cis-trans isomerase (trigger factor)
MRTKVNRLLDYREVPFERQVVIRDPDAAWMKKRMNALTRRRKQTVRPERIEPGDVATLALKSTLERFNRPTVPVTVGSGIFSAELEAQLPGMAVGESKCCTVQGTTVTVTVQDIRRTVFPEPTDEDLRAFAQTAADDFSGIDTVEAYRTWLTEGYRKEQRNHAVFDTMQHVLDTVLAQSDWDFSDEDLEELYRQGMEQLRQEVEEENGPRLEEMTSEQLIRVTGLDSLERIRSYLREQGEPMLASFVWLAVCNGKDPAELSLEEAGALSWEFLQRYVTDSISFKEEP